MFQADPWCNETFCSLNQCLWIQHLKDTIKVKKIFWPLRKSKSRNVAPHKDGIWSISIAMTLNCMKTEQWPLRGAFLPQGRQLWEQPWPAWQDEVIKKKDKMWSLHVERIWLHWLDQFCSQLQVLPWTPHLGKIFKKYPSAFSSLSVRELPETYP